MYQNVKVDSKIELNQSAKKLKLKFSSDQKLTSSPSMARSLAPPPESAVASAQDEVDANKDTINLIPKAIELSETLPRQQPNGSKLGSSLDRNKNSVSVRLFRCKKLLYLVKN